jgi:hypothetical protein
MIHYIFEITGRGTVKTHRLYLYRFQSLFKKDPFKKGAYKKFLEKVTIFIFEHFLYHNCDTKTYKKPLKNDSCR